MSSVKSTVEDIYSAHCSTLKYGKDFFAYDEIIFDHVMQEKSQMHTAFPAATSRLGLSSFEKVKYYLPSSSVLRYGMLEARDYLSKKIKGLISINITNILI